VNPGRQCFLLAISGIFQAAAFDYSQQGLPQYCHEIASAASNGAAGDRQQGQDADANSYTHMPSKDKGQVARRRR